MESKKINQLATELTPSLDDLTIIGDPSTGISKKITLSQMAALFTGTVEEYASLAAFPLVGVADTIYIATDTNILYRWSTSLSAYVELSPNIISSLVFNDSNGFDGTISLVGSTATLTITTTLTSGSVAFGGASGALSQDNTNFYWDNSNKRLGINTNAPTVALDVFGSGIIGRVNGTSTNNAFLGFASAGTNKWSIGNVQSDHRFRIYNEATTSELVSVLQTGEFGIGIANPTTKFHIDGAASALIVNLDANVSIAKSISFRSDNSNRWNIEDSGTESTGNAGMDFFLRSYSDAGALIETPFSIVRSTGVTTIKSLTLTNALSAANGGTGITSYTIGDLIYASGSTTLAKLADVATGNALISGGVGVAPSWGKIDLTTTITGTLPVANGGTGATSFTAGRVLFGNGTSAINTSANLFWDNTNSRLGIGITTPFTKFNLEGGHVGILSNSTSGTDGANDVRRAGYGFIHPDNKNLISALINTSAATDWGLNLHFNTRATNAVMSATPAMTITSGQKVGIGVTSPYGLLQITGGHVVIQGNSTAGTDGTGDVRNAGFGFRKPSNDLISALINTTDVADWGMNMHFFTRQFNATMPATPVLTISSDQYVGVLNTAPQGRLHIGSALQSSSDAAALILKQTSTTATTGIYLERSGEQKGYYMYVGGSLDSLTFQRNNAGTKADVMSLTRDGKVGIGWDSPASPLSVRWDRSTTFSGLGIYDSQAYNASNHGGTITFGGTYTTGNDYTEFAAVGGLKESTVSGNYDGALIFYSRTNGQQMGERMRITGGGEVLMHQTSFNSSLDGQLFGTSGDTYLTRPSNPVLYINRRTNDGTLIDLQRDNVSQGSISVSSGVVSYNSFLGSHWSQFSDGERHQVLKGTIIEAIDEMCEWEDETNDRLPKSKISDTIESKNVYGVFLDWDNDWKTSNDFYVASVGLGFIRINSNEIIKMGDYLQSNGDGTAKVQSDDILRSSTIAKVVSTNKITTYDDGSYLIAATLHCG